MAASDWFLPLAESLLFVSCARCVFLAPLCALFGVGQIRNGNEKNGLYVRVPKSPAATYWKAVDLCQYIEALAQASSDVSRPVTQSLPTLCGSSLP